LLPLTFSDGISIDASEAESSPSATDGAFNFKHVFQQMMSAVEAAPTAPTEQHSDLVSFDNVLAKLPRTRPVRLYPVTARNNGVMWEAVQQAFAFFSSADNAADGAAAGSPAAAAAAGSAAAAAAGSSIQSLDLTQQAAKRLQQQQQLSSSSFSESPGPARDGSSRLGLVAGSSSAGIAQSAAAAGAGSGTTVAGWTTPDAAASISSSSFGPHLAAVAAGLVTVDRLSVDSPSAGTSKAATAAAAASSQLFGALGSSLGGAAAAATAGLRTPPGPAVSGLNDILEIRTDVQPVRMISQPYKPPLVSYDALLCTALYCQIKCPWLYGKKIL
jgi:hypothetical protein